VHKRTVTKRIDQGKGAVAKSTDRKRRVQGENRHGSKGSDDTLVNRAFHFNAAEDSEEDMHKTGDCCVASVKAKGEGQTSKKWKFLIVGEMKQFGPTNKRAPVNVNWERGGELFNTAIEVVGSKSFESKRWEVDMT